MFNCRKREPAALDCEPAEWIASRVARNVSPAVWSVADNLSRKRAWIASRGRYDCKPLHLTGRKPLLRKANQRAFARESASAACRDQQGIDRHAKGVGDALQVVQGDVSDLALAVRHEGAM